MKPYLDFYATFVVAFPQALHLYLYFQPTDGAARIFHRDLLSQRQVDLYCFFHGSVEPQRETTQDTTPTG